MHLLVWPTIKIPSFQRASGVIIYIRCGTSPPTYAIDFLKYLFIYLFIRTMEFSFIHKINENICCM